MVRLTFKKEVAERVDNGIITQAIAPYVGEYQGIIEGNTIFLFTGKKQKDGKMTRKVKCNSLERFTLKNGAILNKWSDKKTRRVARDEGLKNPEELYKYITQNYGPNANMLLLKWKELN